MTLYRTFFAIVLTFAGLACSNNHDEVEHEDDDNDALVDVNVTVNRSPDDDRERRRHRDDEAIRGYHVIATADPALQVSGSIYELTPDDRERQLYQEHVTPDGRFHFEQELVEKDIRLEARFWVDSPDVQPLLVPLEPDRELRVEIIVANGRVDFAHPESPPPPDQQYEETRVPNRAPRHEHRDDDDDEDDDDDDDDDDEDDRDDDDDDDDDD